MQRSYLLFLILLTTVSACAQDFNKVKHELENIHKEDQETRYKFMEAITDTIQSTARIDSLGKVMEYKDSVNLIHVSRILDSYGWLSADKVGEDGNQTLFLVIQHADLQTQLKYIPMLREAVGRGDGTKRNLAMMEDRIATRQHKLQIYGSQIGQFMDSKRYYVLPLLDPESVDLRRAEVGMQPMASYIKQFNLTWDPKENIKELPRIKELSDFKQ